MCGRGRRESCGFGPLGAGLRLAARGVLPRRAGGDRRSLEVGFGFVSFGAAAELRDEFVVRREEFAFNFSDCSRTGVALSSRSAAELQRQERWLSGLKRRFAKQP